MTLTPTRAPTVIDLMTRLLDQQYVQAAGAVVQAVSNGSSSGIMAQRLKELDAEAARLVRAGLRLTPDNPVVRALLADFETTMQANQALVNSAAGAVQESGIQAAAPVTRQLALPGFSDRQLEALGIRWNVPNPEAINRVVGYATSDAWRTMLAGYGDGAVNSVLHMATLGMIEGWGPVRTAREVRRLVEDMPVAQANNLLRTLQMTSFREAQVVHRVANAGILEYQIRISALDPNRSCLACIYLHGQELPIDARIDDHWSGLCTSITKVKNLPAPSIQSGEEWFKGRTEAEQRSRMGNAAFDAWKAGKVELKDFVQKTTDPVFGPMVREASLKGILGKNAELFYAGGPGIIVSEYGERFRAGVPLPGGGFNYSFGETRSEAYDAALKYTRRSKTYGGGLESARYRVKRGILGK